MEERIFKDNYTEAIFGQIVIEEINRRIAEAEAEAKNEKVVFSEAHEKRMQKMFAREHRKEFFKILALIGKKVAIFTVVFVAGISAFLLTFSPDVRAAVKDTFITWYEKFTQFEPKTSEEEFIPDLNFIPSFVPEGYIEEKITETLSVYSKSDEEFIVFEYMPVDGTTSVNNEGVEYKLITENGIDYHTFVSAEQGKLNSIMWENKGYRFSLDGCLDTSVLLEIAKSVGKI